MQIKYIWIPYNILYMKNIKNNTFIDVLSAMVSRTLDDN